MTSSVDLTDAAVWERGDISDVIADLRAAGAVQRMVGHGEGPFWSVLTYQACHAVLTDSSMFSSTGGSLLGSGENRMPAGSGRMMALSDSPRHAQLRSPVIPLLSVRATRGRAALIEDVATAAIEHAMTGDVVDLVDAISIVPLAVMCDLLAVSDGDREMVSHACDEAFMGRTAEARRLGHQRLIPFLFQEVINRRKDPGDDLISTLANHVVDGRLQPVEDVVLNLDNILVGGVQTVRHAAVMGIWTLIHAEASWRSLSRGDVALDRAVDELLRFTSVGRHVLRTATRSTELAGQRIERNDRVVVWTWAANHDPAVFDRPDDVVLDRSPNPHLALGVGAHYCIGAPVARAELIAVFRALFDRVSSVELAGEPTYNGSIINFGFDSFPVRLRARRN